MGCQNTFFFFVSNVCFFPCKRKMNRMRACSPVCSSSPRRPGCEWLCWHWSGFCSLKPGGEKRWKLFTLLHVQIHLFHATTEMESLFWALGLTGTFAQWTKCLVNLGLQPYHTTGWETCTPLGVTAPSPSPKKPSPGWVFQSWWQRTSFSPWDHTKMLSKAWQTAILCQSTACKFASGLTMFYHWQQCKMLFRECSVHWAACSRSGRGKDRTTWIPDSCSQGSTNPTHLKVRHLLEASFLGFLCGQWKDISRGQFLPS